LAVVAPAEYQPFVVLLRGGPAAQNWKTLFDDGMALYSKGNYSEAVVKLSQSRGLNPNDAGVQFYLGVSFLLTESPDSAVVYFQNVLDSEDANFVEAAHWFLGNAYLLKETPSRAAEHFERVLTFDGKFKSQASELLQRISQREDRPQVLKALQHLKKNLKEILD
jgi:tetratricopeptide (TPR) repeat protein